MTSQRKVLVLGGTSEARRLALLLEADPSVDVVSSLAGRVRDPALPVGAVRSGGFGGVDGLREWLRGNHIDVVVDATHPYADRMSANAAAACAAESVPLVAIRRPFWTAGEGDLWTSVPSTAAAAAELARRTVSLHVLSTIGRQGVHHFASITQHSFVIRCIDPPDGPMPVRAEILAARGPFRFADELALLRDRSIDVVVSKNSGGDLTRPKLDAARRLGIEVVMIDRPALPDGVLTVTTADDAARAVSHGR